MANSPDTSSGATTAIIIALNILLCIWSLWEFSFQCYRHNTIVESLFSQTTWICLVTFLTGMFFICYYAVKKWSYDDRRSYEALRAVADMCQFTLALFVVNVWNEMAKSLHHAWVATQKNKNKKIRQSKKENEKNIGEEELKEEDTEKEAQMNQCVQVVLGHLGWTNFIYIFLRSFETIFRIPEPNGWRSMRSVATVLRGGSLALYFVLMICIALLTQGTYQTLKGLVAKQRAGDLLKRKVVQMTGAFFLFFFSCSFLSFESRDL